MTVELKLDYRRQYSWTRDSNFMFIGHLLLNGQVFDHASQFRSLALMRQIESANGSYAAVLLREHILTCWVDTAASFPLFYKLENGRLEVSDFEGVLPELKLDEIPPKAREAFLKLYCTEGRSTLLPEWQSIPAGHCLSADLETGEVRVVRYFNHFKENKDQYQGDFLERSAHIFNTMTHDMLAFCQGRTALVPLSGGYDSRLILSMLVKGGHPDILCYTYGRKDSHEMTIASRVAVKLGVRHECIVYDKEVFQAYFSQDWKLYEQHNHHFQSLPHEQEYFALNELRKRGFLDRPFVAIPGYCGDIAGGSFLKNHSIRPDDFIRKQYDYQPSEESIISGISGWDSYQQWLCENRLSKFIVNGVRVFEHFGGLWMLPFWHRDFLDHFYAIPHQERLGQKAYLEALFSLYFDPLGIAFRKPVGDIPATDRSIKDFLKESLPEKWVNLIRKHTSKSKVADPCNLHLLCEMIYDDLKRQGRYILPGYENDINRLRAYIWMLGNKGGRKFAEEQ